jgi:hypothetical protein
VFINRFPLASPSETRECPEKESTSSTDKGPEVEGDQVTRDGETKESNVSNFGGISRINKGLMLHQNDQASN